MTYTCYIIDDQLESVNLIKDHVEQTPQLEVKLATTNAIEALNALDSDKPDIIFLDIEMPEISGIDFIDNIYSKWGNNMPKVVFATGYNEYAIQGFEYGAVDYILKPVTFSRFKKSIDRILCDLERSNTIEPSLDYFFADIEGKKVRINFDDIIYVEGARNYIIIAMSEKKTIIYKSMRSMLEILPDKDFIRIHKSYIGSIHKVHSIFGNNLVFNVGNKEIKIPIGVTFKSEVLSRLQIS